MSIRKIIKHQNHSKNMEKVNKKFDFFSQGYAAPRAESVEMSNQGMLCASPSEIDGAPESMTEEEGSWG